MALARLKMMPARLRALPPALRAMPKVAERFYTSEGWKAYRKAHRAWTVAQHGVCWCVVCGHGGRLILDHVIERKDGGEDFPPYPMARWYCMGCHNRKSADARSARARGGV